MSPTIQSMADGPQLGPTSLNTGFIIFFCRSSSSHVLTSPLWVGAALRNGVAHCSCTKSFTGPLPSQVGNQSWSASAAMRPRAKASKHARRDLTCVRKLGCITDTRSLVMWSACMRVCG